MTKYMLLQDYSGPAGCKPMTEWDPADVKAHIEFQIALNQELAETGELVDAQGLAGPDLARFVIWDGQGAPVVTDGPFPESKELLAGYRMIDVASEARAIEIAARAAVRPAGGHYRLDAVRGHLRELDGDWATAAQHYRAAAGRATNLAEQQYLTMQAAKASVKAAEAAARVSDGPPGTADPAPRSGGPGQGGSRPANRKRHPDWPAGASVSWCRPSGPRTRWRNDAW